MTRSRGCDESEMAQWSESIALYKVQRMLDRKQIPAAELLVKIQGCIYNFESLEKVLQLDRNNVM